MLKKYNFVAYGSDYVKIYTAVAGMLVFGLAVLGRFIAGIRIDQAVKLGED